MNERVRARDLESKTESGIEYTTGRAVKSSWIYPGIASAVAKRNSFYSVRFVEIWLTVLLLAAASCFLSAAGMRWRSMRS